MGATYIYAGFAALLLGICLASLAETTPPVAWWLIFMAGVTVLLWRRTGFRFWLICCVVFAGVALGLWRLAETEAQFGHSDLATLVDQAVELKGVVVQEPDRRESSLHLFVRVDDDLLRVSTDRYTKVVYGDEVLIRGKLTVPKSFTTDLGRTFDYPGYLRARGVEYQISFATVEVIASGAGNPIISRLLWVKDKFLTEINLRLPEPMAGLGAGVLLGVKQALGEKLELAFRQTGIIHIVVLSGYNIMLVVTFIVFIIGSFLSARGTFVVGVVAISAFALMVGLTATVSRACLMAGILLFAQATGRRYLALRALCVAGGVMLIMNPLLLLYDVGFQLSFAATLGLILLSPYVSAAVPFIPRKWQINQLFAATVSTQIAVLPILMHQIGEVSIIGLVVNLLVVPMVPVAMFATFALGMLGLLIPILAPLALPFPYASLRYIVEVATFFANWSLAAITIPEFSLWALGVTYLLYAFGLWWLLRRYPLASLEIYSVGLTDNMVTRSGSSSSQATIVDPLTDWTIVEDREDPVPNTLAAKERPKETTSGDNQSEKDTPVFFR